jgi:hypothetical protein
MPFYEICVEATRNVVVEADDLDHAYDIVGDSVTGGDWDVHTWGVAMFGENLTKEEIESCIRCGAVMLEDL